MAEVYKIVIQQKDGKVTSKRFYEASKAFNDNFIKFKRESEWQKGKVVGYKFNIDKWDVIYEYCSPEYDDSKDIIKKLKDLDV